MIDSCWVALSLVRHLGGRRFRALLNRFGSARAVLDADDDALRRVPGVGSGIAGAIRAVNLDAIEQRLNDWQKAGVRVLSWHDSEYPAPLRVLHDAPPTLFVRGRQFTPDVFAPLTSAAVIGTRTPSEDGKALAHRLGARLAGRGVLIVSGLALGVDSAAHAGALRSGGITTAVLGSGVLSIYPTSNLRLATAILKQGALLCEVAPDAPVSAAGLVARNRLISGLADRVIVIETDEDGGAMHAARFAQAQGKPVYALNCQRTGNQALIAAGAIPFSADVEDLP